MPLADLRSLSPPFPSLVDGLERSSQQWVQSLPHPRSPALWGWLGAKPQRPRADPATPESRSRLSGVGKAAGSRAPGSSSGSSPPCPFSPLQRANASGAWLVLLYALLGNRPVFAFLPPLGRFTTFCNRPCSLCCTSGLGLDCQSPHCTAS